MSDTSDKRPDGWTTVSATSSDKNTPDAKFWVRAVPQTLAHFLLTRIADDVTVASHGDGGLMDDAHFSKQRVLTDCEAKRQIVEARANHEAHAAQYGDRDAEFIAQGLYDAMVALARPYADHPDYREDWLA